MKLFGESERIYRDTLGDKSLFLCHNLAKQASALAGVSQFEKGIERLKEAIAIYEEWPNKNYSDLVLTKVYLSKLLLSADRLNEAEAVAANAYNESSQHLEKSDATRNSAASNLVAIYKKEGKAEAAQSIK